ncbi:MAG: glycyl-radical enzyme activating protein [Bacteroidetes bacterium]|nr:MAG: glycyl-radical enzyme activating protein [Bacteroidota bacterium]
MTETEGKIFKVKRFSVHDGPGIRTAVFLKGCPLNCIWCHSPEGISSDISIWYNRNLCIACSQCVRACPNNALQLISDTGSYIKIDREVCNVNGACVNVCPTNAMQFTGLITTVSEIISEIKKDIAFYQTSGGGITLTGGEPLFQPDFSMGILETCRKLKIHTAIETSLFCERDKVKGIYEFVDLFIVDMKLFDPVLHIDFTGKSNEIIKENFRYIAKSGKDILVRIPLINNITDTDSNKKAILNFVHGINEKIPVEFISYNPLAGNNYMRLGIPFSLK